MGEKKIVRQTRGTLEPPEGLYPTGLGNRGYKLLPKSPRGWCSKAPRGLVTVLYDRPKRSLRRVRVIHYINDDVLAGGSFRPLVTVGPAGFIAFLPLTVWALGFIPWMAKLNTIERLAKSEAIIMLKQQAPGFNLKGSEQC